jgi:hypothetical protein
VNVLDVAREQVDLSRMHQKRRGVRSGLPDVLVMYRRDTGTIVIFIELMSRRGVASNVDSRGL